MKMAYNQLTTCPLTWSMLSPCSQRPPAPWLRICIGPTSISGVTVADVKSNKYLPQKKTPLTMISKTVQFHVTIERNITTRSSHFHSFENQKTTVKSPSVTSIIKGVMHI